MPVTYVPRDVSPGQLPDGIILNVATTNLRLLSSLADTAASKAKE